MSDLVVDAPTIPVEERHPLGWTERVLHSVRTRLRAVTPVVLHRAGVRGYRAVYLGRRYRVERGSPRDLWEVWLDDGSDHGAGLLLLGATRDLPGAREVIGLHGSGECADLAALLRWAIRVSRRGAGQDARGARRRVAVTLDEGASGWLGT